MGQYGLLRRVVEGPIDPQYRQNRHCHVGSVILDRQLNEPGIVFRITASNGKGKILYTFTNGADGGYPAFGQITVLKGVIYGGVSSVNNDNIGGIYTVDIKTGQETLVHHFAFARESGQPGGVTQCNGIIYGVNGAGGAQNQGTVFSFDPATGKETTLYTFQGGTDSATPFARAPLCQGEYLYETAGGGGTTNYGTVFRINAKTGEEKILHDFTGGQDGGRPFGIIRHDRIFYGSTIYGPSVAAPVASGTLFQLTPQ